MSNKNVFHATREAMGEDFITPKQETGFTKRANEIKDEFPTANHDEVVLEAIVEAFGTGVLNPNIQRQIKDRVKVLNKEGEDAPPAPGTEPVKAPESKNKANLGPMNNQGPNVGTDAGKPEKIDSILGDEKNINAQNKKAFEEGKFAAGGNATGLSGLPVNNSQTGPANTGSSFGK